MQEDTIKAGIELLNERRRYEAVLKTVTNYTPEDEDENGAVIQIYNVLFRDSNGTELFHSSPGEDTKIIVEAYKEYLISKIDVINDKIEAL